MQNSEISHTDKIAFLLAWCDRNNAELLLEGTCGFGRECVGVSAYTQYPDYEWYDEEYERIDGNGDVWTPEDAYHKHPCVAVLGRGENSVAQLYDWIKWFDANGFVLEVSKHRPKNELDLALTKGVRVRMVKK